jgi:hypothetical protein
MVPAACYSCAASPFEGNFLKAYIDYPIEEQDALHVTSILVSIFKGSVEIKVPHKEPVNIIIYRKRVNPINEILPFLPLTRTINHGESPLFSIKS